jgi:hypothetical protein
MCALGWSLPAHFFAVFFFQFLESPSKKAEESRKELVSSFFLLYS